MKIINELLNNHQGNYIFPFFWQHGEDEDTLREYMQAIYDAGIRSVCVECRPHPDFCGPKWWQDMDVILDEARRRGMNVYILDDDHFPTGHANGSIENADISLRPWYVETVSADCYGPAPANRFDIRKAVKDRVAPKHFPGMPPARPGSQKLFFEDDEEILSVTAWEVDNDGRLTNCRDLSAFVHDAMLTWDVPDGSFRIHVTFLSHNGNGRTDYINILDHDSVRVLIDSVYEKHFEKYAEDFGKTILGFFSDEPMTGNIAGMYASGRLGSSGTMTNPWQKDMPALLKERLGDQWALFLPLLWSEGTDQETVRVRQAYMDCVTRLIERNFAGQLSEWCTEHNVEYIGHIWEDKHLSYALGGGLGYYFRAMHGNHMGGVDLVFNSQMHPWSHHSTKDSMGGDFYYYTLGKLASSHAHIDPHKKGRALCEIFGATGWDFGVDKMKYLADNFLVSGINRYVPHAFSPKAFPDPDCPPHFYAHGENAQFPAFKRLMTYMQRMCHLLSGGKTHPEAAVLYHAENDWVSEMESVRRNMYCDVPAKLLGQAQIDYDIIPSDVLSSCLSAENKDYPAGLTGQGLTVNGYCYKALIVPEADFTSEAVAAFSEKAASTGFPIFFIGKLPEAETAAGRKTAAGKVVAEKDLVRELRSLGLGEIRFSKESRNLRFLHYTNDSDIYLLVNNDLGSPYEGTVTISDTRKAWIYDAYDNRIFPAEQTITDGTSVIQVCISAFNPLLLVFDDAVPDVPGEDPSDRFRKVKETGKELIPETWMLSSCMAKEYPHFGRKESFSVLDDVSVSHPEMMDVLLYETTINLPDESFTDAFLTLDWLSDPAEVTVNGISCGMRIAPDWTFDLSEALHPGENALSIEVRLTPTRKVEKFYPPEGPVFSRGPASLTRPEGIIGRARIVLA